MEIFKNGKSCSGVKIISAEAGMLNDIIKIENKSFSTPWNKRDFEVLMVRDYSDVIVALNHDKTVIGYGCMTTICDESEIIKIAVDERFRRKGIGSILLQKLKEISSLKGGNKIYLEVRKSNMPARKLYSSCGFCENGFRKNYYTNPLEDAVTMICDCEKQEK